MDQKKLKIAKGTALFGLVAFLIVGLCIWFLQYVLPYIISEYLE